MVLRSEIERQRKRGTGTAVPNVSAGTWGRVLFRFRPRCGDRCGERCGGQFGEVRVGGLTLVGLKAERGLASIEACPARVDDELLCAASVDEELVWTARVDDELLCAV